VTLAIALAALVTAVPALVLAIVVMRQNADTTRELRVHRRGHARTEGLPDPDRRRQHLPPPDGVDRRTPDRARPPVPPRMVTVDQPMTAEHAQQVRHELETAQLEQQDAPTTQLPAQPRPRPENAP
jgi:hypothetical protein